MQQYIKLLKHTLDNGVVSQDRTGVGTLSCFGEQLKFNLQLGFPLLTTKRLHTHSIITELLWFLKGNPNTQYLKNHNVTIWDEWETSTGDLGPIYPYQWCNWGGNINQIAELVKNLKNNPYSRRHIVSAWAVHDLPYETIGPQGNVELGKMALAPCHCLFQCYVRNNVLSLQMYQRSADLFLGVPYNIASYAFLTHMLAQQCGFSVGDLIITFGDVHLYSNHVEQAREQLKRVPKELPNLTLENEAKDIFSYEHSDFTIWGYKPHPSIPAPIAV